MEMRSKADLRKRIIEEELLDFDVKVSDRNKEIVRKYVEGVEQSALADEYGLSSPRIHRIVANYVSKCHMKRREWLEELLKEYAKKEGIRTTPDRLGQASVYMLDAGYGESLYVATEALIADGKIRKLL